jgi:hypothetical protein
LFLNFSTVFYNVGGHITSGGAGIDASSKAVFDQHWEHAAVVRVPVREYNRVNFLSRKGQGSIQLVYVRALALVESAIQQNFKTLNFYEVF